MNPSESKRLQVFCDGGKHYTHNRSVIADVAVEGGYLTILPKLADHIGAIGPESSIETYGQGRAREIHIPVTAEGVKIRMECPRKNCSVQPAPPSLHHFLAMFADAEEDHHSGLSIGASFTSNSGDGATVEAQQAMSKTIKDMKVKNIQKGQRRAEDTGLGTLSRDW